ncbi:DUF4291 domain-containing protein [Comamonas guangdongensis]|uniref:DUF4291 domain-containing protein n=1 Tax=Comamonas guangdongensis TaxID=510515 RepID=A0ABV3ZWB6_9BURK
MKLSTAPYLQQAAAWPQSGEHILAHHDETSVIVYQAYRPSIGAYAIRHGRLGGPDFSLARMSWIKPNFLWMMYRSGWGVKQGQEIILGLRISRRFFDSVLHTAVPSTWDAQRYPALKDWRSAVAQSEVRLQWDPDHTPSGLKHTRRAVQLGLRGQVLAAFAGEQLLEVIDMTDFVAEQRSLAHDDSAQLLTPVEHVYVPGAAGAGQHPENTTNNRAKEHEKQEQHHHCAKQVSQSGAAP